MMRLLWAASFCERPNRRTDERSFPWNTSLKTSVVACARVIDEDGELQSFRQSFGTTTSDLGAGAKGGVTPDLLMLSFER